MRTFLVAVVAFLVLCGTATAQTPADLRQAFERVYANPLDIQANLDYARAAERYGHRRLATEAYSRVLERDPDNIEAGRALLRLMGVIVPPSTTVVAVVGAEFQGNPLLRRSGSKNDLIPSARLLVNHERPLLGLRWRAQGDLYANRYALNHPEVSFAYLGGRSGPLIPLTRDWRLFVAPGGGAAYLDGHFLFAEAGGQVSLERVTAGAFRGVDVRASYVYVAREFSNRNGAVVDVSPHFAWGNVFAAGDALTFRIGYRLSAVSARRGGRLNDFPGHFHQVGAVAEYLMPLRRGVFAGPTLALHHRWFLGREVRHPGESHRRDILVAPGAKLVWREAIPRTAKLPPADIVGFYQFQWNHSTVGAESYKNHRVGVQLVWRFHM